ncbi:MAG: hypothetical protein QOG55_687 [Acidobacteriaceae bacterium]|jgi:hypothetical protein|nr:hypothetical protein [Acidobacteriaceae bacterium]
MKPRRRVDLATIILHMPPVSNEVANQSSSQIAKSSSGFASEMHPGAAHAFWQILTLFDSAKLSTHRAFRNALGVVLPLIAGFALNMPRGGLVVASGALNVSYSDGSDPYSERVKRMLASSVICAVAVFVGAVSGKHIALAVTLAAVWAFIAGMFVAVSGAGPDLGIISLVTLLIYAAQRLSPREAAISGVLALAREVYCRRRCPPHSGRYAAMIRNAALSRSFILSLPIVPLHRGTPLLLLSPARTVSKHRKHCSDLHAMVTLRASVSRSAQSG